MIKRIKAFIRLRRSQKIKARLDRINNVLDEFGTALSGSYVAHLIIVRSGLINYRRGKYNNRKSITGKFAI